MVSVIEQLRYVRLGTRDLSGAVDFAQRILGLQLVEKTDEQAAFRSDSRDHTLVFVAGDPTLQSVGFELRDADALAIAMRDLAAAGFAVAAGNADDAARRKVRQLAFVTDASGNVFELVTRPLHSGWRYFPSRDAGVLGLQAVAMRTTAVQSDEALWTRVFNGRVSDWVGDAPFIRFDDAHHRLALYPSSQKGVLAVEFAVESVDLLMQNSYFLQSAQVRIVHGPGRRPTSDQLFLTFVGPDDVLFSFVAEGNRISDETKYRPRQFSREASSFCSWGSVSDIAEFS
jgi:2,3-dihydroxy-p-cumate/2,3-dihydroxybenzoate 3,4-dioxygenase